MDNWCVRVQHGMIHRIIYPIDSVRRRMMMEAGREQRLYKSSFHCFKTMVMTEGYRGFYRGLSANLIRGMGTSILLVMYDEVRALLAMH